VILPLVWREFALLTVGCKHAKVATDQVLARKFLGIGSESEPPPPIPRKPNFKYVTPVLFIMGFFNASGNVLFAKEQ